MTSAITELTQALGELQAIDLALRSALDTTHGPVELEHDSGQLTVTVDGDHRITAVVVGSDWRRAIAPAALGTEILALTEQGSLTRLAGVLDTAAAAVPTGAPPIVPAAGWSVPDPVRDRLADEARTLNHDLDRLIDAAVHAEPARADEPDPQDGDGERFTSRHGGVTAVVDAGRVCRLVTEERWAAHAGRQSVNDTVLEALTAAYAHLDRDASGEGVGDSADPPAATAPPDRTIHARIAAVQAEIDDFAKDWTA